MLKRNKYLVNCMLFLAILAVNQPVISSCPSQSSLHEVIIRLNDPLARPIGEDFFGFDTPWAEFQSGYFSNGAVKASLIEYLKPFRGALYRYPGGNFFDWENSILNSAARKPNFTEYLGYPRPVFGLQEFLYFLKSVDGAGIYTLNLLGDRDKTASLDWVQRSNKDLMKWVRSHPQGSRVKYWEMGNELDWVPFNMNASEYVRRMSGTLAVAKKEFPDEKIIVAGRTNPWQFGIESEVEFNKAVLDAFAFYGISLHAYYDGYPMTMMQKTIARYAKVPNKMGQSVKVFVTEHGRWPSEKASGHWEDNWYQASGSLGAVSASDFTLMSLNMPEVATAIWHNLGTHGPWQLIRKNSKDSSLYPSATYWALRTLREGFLSKVISLVPDVNASAEYAGGYSLRLAAMQGDNKSFSLLGVNRSRLPIKVLIELDSKVLFSVSKSNITKLDIDGADNSESSGSKFTMVTSTINSLPQKQFEFCVPAFSVFSLLAGAI